MRQTVDPAVCQVIAELEALGKSGDHKLEDLTAEQARSWFIVLRALLGVEGGAPNVASVRDDHVQHGTNYIPIRIYDTDESMITPERLVVYVHGGGWVVGDLDSADLLARNAAHHLQARVVSVDYRLAPEDAFPAAYDDCAAVLAELARDYPDTSIAAVGDSAGANVVGALAATSRQRGDIRIDAQLLFYPALDPSMSSESMTRLADGYLLTRADMAYYWSCYLKRPEDATDPRATPASLTDLSGMPPTVLVTAGFDPLHDEGSDYARRLVAADVATSYLPFPTLVHGFVDMAGRVPAAQDALIGALSVLKAHLTTATGRGWLGRDTTTAPRYDAISVAGGPDDRRAG